MNHTFTKVICPNCGAEIEIAKNEYTVANATVIGENSGLGVVELPLKNKSKAEIALKKMEAAGLPTDGYFALDLGDNESRIAFNDGGTIRPVVIDDPIYKKIVEEGTIENKYLHRRWLVSQLMRMMFNVPVGHTEPLGIHNSIKAKGYKYAVDTLTERLRVQAIMFDHGDYENYDDDNYWINKETARAFADDFKEQMVNYINNQPKLWCRSANSFYKRIFGMDIAIKDIENGLLPQINANIERLHNAVSPMEVYEAFRDFRNVKLKNNKKTYEKSILWEGFKIPKCFINAYKGAGGYGASKNLVMFGGYVIYDNENCKTLNRIESLEYLRKMRDEYRGWELGYKMMGLFKDIIEFNGISYESLKAKWFAEKCNK